jgi:hypothetical protein
MVILSQAFDWFKGRPEEITLPKERKEKVSCEACFALDGAVGVVMNPHGLSGATEKQLPR